MASINTYPAFSYLLLKMNSTYPIGIVKVALGSEDTQSKQTLINEDKCLNKDQLVSWDGGVSRWLIVHNDKKGYKDGDVK